MLLYRHGPVYAKGGGGALQSKVCWEEYRRTVVCIDSYENMVPTGKFYNLHHEGIIPFHGTIQFLSKMEDMLNELEFPLPFTAMRSFDAPSKTFTGTFPETEAQYGKKATFMLRIVLRQNTSWQGSVTWLEGNRSQSFRSVLELLLLMDSALRIKGRDDEASST